ncbi:cholesterol 7-alpha-monooxygenase-like [Arapaima gigas]
MAALLFYAPLAALCALLAWLLCGVRRRQLGEPPLMNGWIPYLGVALEYGRNPLEFLRSMQRKYGDIFTCKIAGNYFTFVLDPFSHGAVSRQGRNLDFQKFAIGFSQKVFGHADFSDPVFSCSYRDIHSIFRQTLQGPVLQQLISTMMENLQAVMRRDEGHGWANEGLQVFVDRIMFEAGYLTLFGKEGEEEAEAMAAGRAAPRWIFMRQAMEDFHAFDKAFPEMAAGLPIHLCGRAFRAREALAEKLHHRYLKRNKCLSALIERRMHAFDQMEQLDEKEKARTHVSMLWASQANTLPATFWSLYYILRCPEALETAQAEVERILEESGHTPSNLEKPVVLFKDQLDSMSVLGDIIEESLRLSSASIMIRVASENFTLTLDTGKTAAIRKGDHIAMFPQMMHMDPEIYQDPTEFKFNRFLDENRQKKTDFYKNGRKLRQFLLPFGSGVSECPGRFFAVNEIKQFLTLALCYYDMELQDLAAAPLETDCTRAGLGILPPKHDVSLRYRFKDSIAVKEKMAH